MSLVSLKKSRRSSHRRATIAMTAWPTRHTAADWHPTAKGQFRQMTKFRELFPYVFSIGYRHVRYVYSQLARTAPNEKSLPTSLFEHPQKGTPPLQWRAPNREPLGSERREALTHHTAQSLNPLVGRNEHHTSPPLSRLLHDYHQERAKLGQIGILIHMHQHTDDTDRCHPAYTRRRIVPLVIHRVVHTPCGSPRKLEPHCPHY